jgi:hypothetical protein
MSGYQSHACLCYSANMYDRLYVLAAQQHGVVSRKQAFELGVSPGQWNWLLQTEEWKRMYAGVARHTAARQSVPQTLMAGQLAVGGVVSHRSAGQLWGLPGLGDHFEITVAQRRRVALDGFTIHRAQHLGPGEISTRQGIPVTSLPRTVVDVALLDLGAAPALVDHVLARRTVALDLLIATLEALGIRGRLNASALRQLLEVRLGRSRHVDSWLQAALEQIAWDGYHAGLLPEPVPECPIPVGNGRFRYADVGYPPYTVGFEAASYQYHGNIEDFARDQERNLEATVVGWVLVPVTKEIVCRPAFLTAQMARILRHHGWPGPAAGA